MKGSQRLQTGLMKNVNHSKLKTTLAQRNFILEFGQRFYTPSNSSQIHKVIEFNPDLLTSGLEISSDCVDEQYTVCISASYGVDWNEISPPN